MQQRDNQINTTLTLEEQNHLLLQETVKIVRQMRRIYMTQVALTVLFVVLPIIGTAVFLPRMIRSLSAAVQSVTQPMNTESQQEQLNAIIEQLQSK